jgi:hypothetical protein
MAPRTLLMPPRWLCLLIIACWLTTNGWLFYHDLWPYLLPGQPPAFSVDLVDEIQRSRAHVLWIVSQKEGQDFRKVFLARTRIDHPTKDSFDLVAEFSSHPGEQPATLSGCSVTRMFSRYRIDREGRLEEVSLEIQGAPQNQLLQTVFKGDFTLRIEGKVEGGQFRARLDIVDLLTRPLDMPPVAVAHTGAVLLPLHPLQRVHGLYGGQRWSLPVLDPIADSVAAYLHQGGGPRLLAAAVRPELETSPSPKQRGALCWVIDYRGEDTNLSVWVDERTGQVLRQYATLGQEEWVMDRD